MKAGGAAVDFVFMSSCRPERREVIEAQERNDPRFANDRGSCQRQG